MFNVFILLALYVFLFAVALYILYRVVLNAINDSKLSKEVTELRKIVQQLSVKSHAVSSLDEGNAKQNMPSDEYESCPACGYINSIDAAVCVDCQIRLR